MDASFWGYVVAAIISGGFSLYVVILTKRTNRQVTPSNGTSTATIIELLRKDQLAMAEAIGAQNERIEHYVSVDADAHAEIRGSISGLVTQVQALSTPPPHPPSDPHPVL